MILYTPKMKLADIIISNPSLLLILQRFHIDLGFGEKNVTEVCRISGVSEKFFLLICNVYTNDQYLPSIDELCVTDMSSLVPYLIASHNYYLDERIPHIEKHLDRIADACPKNHKEILQRFFHDYKAEVQNHFLYEEKIVFPYIENLSNGDDGSGYSINQFEKNHSNIEDKLNDLTNIIIKYLPGNIMPKERISVLFDIFQLSNDLNKHCLIEEKILIPYVEIIERSQR